MTIQEVEKWAETNIVVQNLRTAFLLALDTIYAHSEERITDIEKFYKWFKEKWHECYEVASKNIRPLDENTVLYLDTSPIEVYEMLCNVWLTKTFGISINNFLEENGRKIKPVYFQLAQTIVQGHWWQSNETLDKEKGDKVETLPNGDVRVTTHRDYSVAYHTLVQ